MNKTATGIVAYLGPIGFFVAYLLGDRKEARFHLNQALVLLIFSLTLSAIQRVAGWIPLLGWIIRLILGLCGLVVGIIWLIAFISATRRRETPMPLLGWIKLI